MQNYPAYSRVNYTTKSCYMASMCVVVKELLKKSMYIRSYMLTSNECVITMHAV